MTLEIGNRMDRNPIQEVVNGKTFRSGPMARRVLVASVGLLIVIVYVAPFLWMLSTSLKTNEALFDDSGFLSRFLPQPFQWNNYGELFSQIPFARYLVNSLVVAACGAMLETAVSTLAAFGLSRVRWKGGGPVYGMIYLSWLIPFSVIMIPRFLMFAYLPQWLWPSEFWNASRVIPLAGVEIEIGRLAGLDSFATLILPASVSVGAAFLLMTAMSRVPVPLLESAYLESGSVWRVFRDIVVPLVKPTIITVAFIAFLSSWQSFTWPLLVTSSLEMQTAPIGLRAFQALHSTQWSLLMAGSVILTLPSIFLLFTAQRYVIDRYELTDLDD